MATESTAVTRPGLLYGPVLVRGIREQMYIFRLPAIWAPSESTMITISCLQELRLFDQQQVTISG